MNDLVKRLMDYDLDALASAQGAVRGKTIYEEAADTIEAQSKLIEELRKALQWMVDNDETNEGDEPLREHGGRSWNEMNAYWIDGINKARAALSKANPHSEKVE